MDEQRIKEARYQQDAFSREAETLEAKARWFRSLTVEERMDMLCEFTDLILSLNPRIVEQKGYAQPASGRVLVLSLTRAAFA